MSECAKCHESVYVPDGYDFEDGDMCHTCVLEDNASLRAKLETARKALEELLRFAEECEVKIEGEWGVGLSLEEIESAGELSQEIVDARNAVKELEKK